MRCDVGVSSDLLHCLVSIHTPTWGVTWLHNNRTGIGMFQSTHLHEVWQITSIDITANDGFNPHTYMRCDQLVGYDYEHYMRFNPHTYMRCDIPNKYYPFMGIVSIHTPTWGVTLFACCVISTRMFQSTHLHEVWQRARAACMLTKVSIHTPTWGVTTVFVLFVSAILFQSTHLHEVWPRYVFIVACAIAFQSTHLHEVWPRGGKK